MTHCKKELDAWSRASLKAAEDHENERFIIRLDEINYRLRHDVTLSDEDARRLEQKAETLRRIRSRRSDALQQEIVEPKKDGFERCKLKHCKDDALKSLAATLSMFHDESSILERCGLPCKDLLEASDELLQRARREGLDKPMYNIIKGKISEIERLMEPLVLEAFQTSTKNKSSSSSRAPSRPKSIEDMFFKTKRDLSVLQKKHPRCRRLYYDFLLDGVEPDSAQKAIHKKYERAISKQKDEARINELTVKRTSELDALPKRQKLIACILSREDYCQGLRRMLDVTVKYVSRIRALLGSRKLTHEPAIDVSHVLDEAKSLAKTFTCELSLVEKKKLYDRFTRLEIYVSHLSQILWKNSIYL